MFKKLLFFHNLTADEVRSKSAIIGKFETPVNNTYSVWSMEEESRDEVLVLIDEEDNEVAGILEARTGKLLYIHPRSIDGVMKLLDV